MKLISFDKPHTIKDYNSNNSWGFGGSVGKQIVFLPDLYLKVGHACTRHDQFPHTTLWWKDVKVLDLSGFGAKEQLIAKQWINSIIEGTIKVTEDSEYPYATHYTIP